MLEDVSGVFVMGFFIQGENEEIVHVDDEPSFGDHVPEGVIHEVLECGWGVGKPKEHDCWLEKPFMGDKGGFPLVTVFDADVVVTPSDVKLGKQLGVFELIDEIGDKGEGVSISNGMFIQVVVILTGTKATIFFFDKEEWGCLRRIQGVNLSTV